MLVFLYHSLFSIFSIYIFIETIHYANFEIKNQKNKYGGIATIVFSVFCILLSNIIVWIN